LHSPNHPAATVDDLLALTDAPVFDLDHPDRNLTTETIYDASGRSIASVSLAVEGCTLTRQAGTVTASAACSVTRTYYDVLGRPYATVRNLKGQAITDPSLPTTNLTTVTNLISHTIYNAAWQAIASIEPDPACVVQRGADGSVISIGSACTIDRTYYDGLGRVITMVRNLVGQSYVVETPPDREARAAHKPYYGNPDQNVRSDTVYNAAGEQTDTIDPNGVVTHFAYDQQSRLTDVYENYRPGVAATSEINVHTLYTYDAMANRLSIRSSKAVLAGTQDLTTFTYDALGRQVSESDPLGHTWRNGYDILGQRVSQWDAYNQETKFSFDDLGRLVRIDYPESDADVSFAYGASGQRKTMTDGLGTTTWEYDEMGWPVAITDPFNKTVGYDGSGNSTSLVYPDQKVVNYEYDGLDGLETVTDWQSHQTSTLIWKTPLAWLAWTSP
jgi:YD repeat-containing protein